MAQWLDRPFTAMRGAMAQNHQRWPAPPARHITFTERA
jgi:hypothetical protein